MRWLCVWSLLLSISGYTLAAELLDENELRSLGERVKYWPVLDVRDLVERSQRPIEGAQQLDDDLEFEVGDIVLVIGDDEESAMREAILLEQQFLSNSAVVVKDGYKTIRTIHGKTIKGLSDSYFPDIFTIPSDTCESGPALHVFDDDNSENR